MAYLIVETAQQLLALQRRRTSLPFVVVIFSLVVRSHSAPLSLDNSDTLVDLVSGFSPDVCLKGLLNVAVLASHSLGNLDFLVVFYEVAIEDENPRSRRKGALRYLDTGEVR